MEQNTKDSLCEAFWRKSIFVLRTNERKQTMFQTRWLNIPVEVSDTTVGGTERRLKMLSLEAFHDELSKAPGTFPLKNPSKTHFINSLGRRLAAVLFVMSLGQHAKS